jgi:hypothetical protein
MAFVGLDFAEIVNPITTFRHVLISHPSVPDVLVLHVMEDPNGYQNDYLGFNKSDGRTLTGRLKVNGSSYFPKPQWNLGYYCNDRMLSLFIELLRFQRISPVSFVDNFEKVEFIPGQMHLPVWYGSPTVNTTGRTEGYVLYHAMIDVDANFKTHKRPGRIFIQFQVNAL